MDNTTEGLVLPRKECGKRVHSMDNTTQLSGTPGGESTKRVVYVEALFFVIQSVIPELL
jgi:hypothetical protein